MSPLPMGREEEEKEEEPDVFKSSQLHRCCVTEPRNGHGAPCGDRVTLMQCWVPGLIPHWGLGC